MAFHDDMRGRDSKTAEQEYLSRSGSLSWELVKPFSPAATDTLAESTRLIHDFSVALAALDVSTHHRILDLGAGACWTSEWLDRLNLDVVSVDIALAMLQVGRQRLRDSSLVVGDLEQLPFPDGSFDRALCLNALHHVPKPENALREIGRVLTPRGRLVLIEPGRGHSDRASSVAAVQQFGVLEQELEPTTLMRLCEEAGFPSVTLRPMSYASGEIELSLPEFSSWSRWTETTRPLRAIEKLWRALLEIFGVAKEGRLLEDALSMYTSRVLMRHITEQPVIVADRSGYQPASRELRAIIRVSAMTDGPSSGVVAYNARILNIGTLTWRTHGPGRVQLGIQVVNPQGIVLDRDFVRVPLPDDVEPGQECGVQFTLPSRRAEDGYYQLDLVAEGISWFEAKGSSPITIRNASIEDA